MRAGKTGIGFVNGLSHSSSYLCIVKLPDRIQHCTMKFSALFLLLPVAAWAGKPIRSLSVTLRGKKFDVEDATTVQDVLGQVKEAAGVDGRLLFGGRQLMATDTLEDIGVQEGDSLQMVPGTVTPGKKKKTKAPASNTVSAGSADVTPTGSGSGMPDLSALLGGERGGMPDLSALLNGAGGGGGMPDMSELLQGGMPDMAESLDMMSNMMNSPIFQEYMNDPEKLESSRQMILQNPMMKQMMGQMPGMAEILEDKDAWREAMTAAANLYKELDPEQLKQAMMGNMPEADDMNGLFGAGSDNGALDELDED